MRDHILNCGYYNELWGLGNIRWALGRAILTFIKTKLYELGQQIVGERVNREITNFHLLRWRATKVVKVVVCARTRILLSLSIA